MRLKNLILAVAMVVTGSASAAANTITPNFDSFVSGVSITYVAELSSGELHTGDGFTIFDVSGYTGVGALAPGWTASTTATGSPFGSPALSTPDIATLINVSFTYSGLVIQHVGGARPLFTPFVILTTATRLATDDWVSRDHLVGSPSTIGDGALSNPSTGQIIVTAPDGGLTLVLLGGALVGLGALRRRFNL